MKYPFLRTIIVWILRIIEFIVLEYTLLAAISVTFSYFTWSPLGYEPCGLQAFAWFLLFYPLLGIDFLLRGTIRYYAKLPKRYLLAPLLIGILFIPAIICDYNPVIAITSAAGAVIAMILLPVFDFYFIFQSLKHPTHPQNSQP